MRIRRGPRGGRAPSGRRLWRQWLLWATAGEMAGFAAPAVVGAATADGPTALTVTGLVAAGAVEGAVLGLAQARVLRRVWPRLDGGRWTAATAAAAAFAWLLGLLPSALHDAVADWPVPVLAALAAVAGPLLLVSVGTAQWWVLRRHVPRARRWIAGSAAGWLLGLLVFTALTSPLWRPGQPAPLVGLIGLLGGTAMAFTAAAVTGWVLVRLAAEQAPAAGGSRDTTGPGRAPRRP
ncbi:MULTISPECIES: hypothetical protein [Streptomyces]|uniref:hypothetical protein n=1 Tax=Streptomyces TaxID=1883 RepID=UPI001D1415FB|nr:MULTISPECIES: hypothetical protein [Streptomyces]MCC3655662.1 hypothetical protein [Streptomyces sp. S07_1.15]WSQ70026.1 hypothetical protein OG463_00370 [Streptomyces xinghaiensis]